MGYAESVFGLEKQERLKLQLESPTGLRSSRKHRVNQRRQINLEHQLVPFSQFHPLRLQLRCQSTRNSLSQIT